MSPDNIDRVIGVLGAGSVGRDGDARHAEYRRPSSFANPACVKVVFDERGRAMILQAAARFRLFVIRIPAGRSTIRRCSTSIWASTRIAAMCCWTWQMQPSSLEQAEKLETVADVANGRHDLGGGCRPCGERNRHAGRLCSVRCPPAGGGIIADVGSQAESHVAVISIARRCRRR